MAIFGGIGIIAVTSRLSGNQELVLSFLILFLVSSSRIVPGLMRIQYYLQMFQKAKSQSNDVFKILSYNDLLVKNDIDPLSYREKLNASNFSPAIVVKDLTFSYDSQSAIKTIDGLEMVVSPGEKVAVAGKSGAGKSTLVDLILGYQNPSNGNVRISGVEPRACFEAWPGAVAYVPQKVTIYEDTLLANIAVGVESNDDPVTRKRVLKLIHEVELGDFLLNLEKGLDTPLSESGNSLSGGQLQRIGIARALYSKPKLLILDESTSSLDSSTEYSVMDFIFKLNKEMTLVMITHRLASIKSVDKIFYLKSGKLVAQGKFEEIRELVPDFEEQLEFLNK